MAKGFEGIRGRIEEFKWHNAMPANASKDKKNTTNKSLFYSTFEINKQLMGVVSTLQLQLQDGDDVAVVVRREGELFKTGAMRVVALKNRKTNIVYFGAAEPREGIQAITSGATFIIASIITVFTYAYIKFSLLTASGANMQFGVIDIVFGVFILWLGIWGGILLRENKQIYNRIERILDNE